MITFNIQVTTPYCQFHGLVAGGGSGGDPHMISSTGDLTRWICL